VLGKVAGHFFCCDNLRKGGNMARMRILLLVAVVAGMAGRASAERKPFAMGLLGGVSVSTYWGENSDEGDFTIFPTAGISAGINLPALLGLELDLLYLDKGGSTKKNENGKIRSNVITAQSLEVPLLIKITAPTGNEVMPIFFGGPAINFLVSSKTGSEYVTTDANGTVTPEPIEPPLIPKADMAKYTLDLMIGGGLEWGLGTLQLRFDLGENSLDMREKVDLKTLSVIAVAGFIF
jgi:hypothetical protein